MLRLATAAACLLLIILFPFDPARGKLATIISNVPTYVGKMEIVENIVVRYFTKQEAVITDHYQGYLVLELSLLQFEALLSRPYSGCSRIWIGSTPREHSVFGFSQSPLHWASVDNGAVVGNSSWSEPVIFDVITEDGMGSNSAAVGSHSAYLAVNLKLLKTGPT